MGFYSRYVLPRVVHFTCGLKPAMRQREKVVPLADGRVLEIGVGSGLNLPLYDPAKVKHVWGLDPSPEMWEMAKTQTKALDFDVEFLQAFAEEIPLEQGSIDTVLVTYTLCTIPDPVAALRDMRRVLRPGGTLVFCEHGIAPDESVQKWQGRMNPIWRRLGGGCHLNRPIPELLATGGFEVRSMETMYLPGWRPASFNFWGTAAPAVRD